MLDSAVKQTSNATFDGQKNVVLILMLCRYSNDVLSDVLVCGYWRVRTLSTAATLRASQLSALFPLWPGQEGRGTCHGGGAPDL